jgi:hypothetical protein
VGTPHSNVLGLRLLLIFTTNQSNSSISNTHSLASI